MTNKRRMLLRYAVAFGAVASCPVAIAQEQAASGVARALNLAGRQRMLAQRAAKAWVMRGLDLQAAQASAILSDSLAAQKQQLAELGGILPNESVRVAHRNLEQHWERYRAVLAQSSVLGNAQAVYDASEEAQERAHRLTLAHERASAAPDRYRLINIAGRQRMLSQRAAKFYLLGLWGVNVPAARLEMNFSRAEFSSGMGQLAAASNTHPSIRVTLDELDRAWIAYRELFVAGRHGEFSREAANQIAARSEEILPIADRLVSHFEQSLQALVPK